VPVTMQKISDDMNKMKSLFFVFFVASQRRSKLKLIQVISCLKFFKSGFLPRIHRSITTLHVKPITMGPLRGSLKEIFITDGRQQALSCGPMGIVGFLSFSTHAAIDLWICSGIRQECSLVGDTSTNFFQHNLYWRPVLRS
jgi:hypothetical protein